MEIYRSAMTGQVCSDIDFKVFYSNFQGQKVNGFYENNP